MFAIYIDPAVCHTWAGYFIPECYGVLIMAGLSLSVSLLSASALIVATAATKRWLRTVRG